MHSETEFKSVEDDTGLGLVELYIETGLGPVVHTLRLTLSQYDTSSIISSSS